MIENRRIFKEPKKVNLPDDNAQKSVGKKSSILELLLHTNGDYRKVSQILDRKIEETNRLIDELTLDINSLSDDAFVDKINKLKSDNLDTMMLCQEFRKIADRKLDKDDIVSDPEINKEERFIRLFDKPPPGPKSKRDVNDYCDQLINSSKDGYTRNKHGKYHIALNDEYDTDDEEAIMKRQIKYQREDAKARLTRSKSEIKNLANDIEYKNINDPEQLIARWRHKVTIPQPFQMTIRDENKSKPYRFTNENNGSLKKSRTLAEFELLKEEQEKLELDELKKQFKANPVPAHVYIPLYAEMQEEANQKRQLFKEYNKEVLKMMEKPFNFYKRELEKQKQKSESAYQLKESSSTFEKKHPGSNKLPLKSYHGERQKTIIRAKPIPKSSSGDKSLDDLKDEELFRQIKAEIRSKKLMEESKLPGNMAERQRIQDEIRQQKKQKVKSLQTRSQSADSIKTRNSIPDFSKIHKEWEDEIRASYKEPHVTQPKPFNLMTERRSLVRSSTELPNEIAQLPVTSDSMKDWNRSILASLEIAKPSPTKSTVLRDQSFKHKKNEEELLRQQKEIEKLVKKKREHEASAKVRQSLELDKLQKPEDKHRQKAKELKVDDELRKENYRKEIEEMNERVKRRPLLCESVKRNTFESKVYGSTTNGSGSNSRNGRRSLDKFIAYDERNHFGDAALNHSTTEASSSIGEHSLKNRTQSHHTANDVDEDLENSGSVASYYEE